MMPGTFILSLDCEGKWGMMDHLDESHEQITTESLHRAYETLTTLLDSYDIKATFAFVMAFLLNGKELERFRPVLQANDPWLLPYQRAMRAGRLEGWHLPEALQIVTSKHEIACHSFSHRPMDDYAAMEIDLKRATEVAEMKGAELKTFVFPRNRIGSRRHLHYHGYLGYRERLRRPSGRLGKVATLVDEINMWPRAQRPVGPYCGIVPIPSGHFVNWRVGPRKRIPVGVTATRLTNLIGSAAKTGGVAHLWLHPHNLITAPDTVDILQPVFAEVSRLVRQGRITVMTQLQYSREMLGAHKLTKGNDLALNVA